MGCSLVLLPVVGFDDRCDLRLATLRALKIRGLFRSIGNCVPRVIKGFSHLSESQLHDLGYAGFNINMQAKKNLPTEKGASPYYIFFGILGYELDGRDPE